MTKGATLKVAPFLVFFFFLKPVSSDLEKVTELAKESMIPLYYHCPGIKQANTECLKVVISSL